MDHRTIVQLCSYLELGLCVAALAAIAHRKQLGRFPLLSVFLAIRVLSFLVLLPLLHFAGHGIPSRTVYVFYFWAYWTSYAVESLLLLGLIFQIFKIEVEPLRGLSHLGLAIFGVFAAIGIICSFLLAVGPHVTPTRFFIRSVTGLQETQTVLTLCMLLVLAPLIRPMHLQLRSRAFGIGLGMAIIAIGNFAVLAFVPLLNLYRVVNIISSLTALTAVGIWAAYFMLPEPQQLTLALPETSRLMRWNRHWLA